MTLVVTRWHALTFRNKPLRAYLQLLPRAQQDVRELLQRVTMVSVASSSDTLR